MKTGNTSSESTLEAEILEHASMEPGHEDREYPARYKRRTRRRTCLNGARP